MDQKYNALFTPWKIGNVEIKNRIVMCSMGGTSLFGWMEPSHFDKEAAYFLLEKARTELAWSCPACSGSVTSWATAGCIRTRAYISPWPST